MGSWPIGRVRGSPVYGQRQSGLPGSRQLQSYRENSQRNKRFMYSQPLVKGLEEKKKKKRKVLEVGIGEMPITKILKQ